MVGLASAMRPLLPLPLAVGLLCCQPPAAPQPAQPEAGAAAAVHNECRDDIPDCVAVCALRETGRTTYIDFYERRCAAVILGKNPDRVVSGDLQPTPYDGGTPEPEATTSFALPTSVPATGSSFDPTSLGRTSTGEPPECKASHLLRAQHRDREADVLAALCVAKGGDAGF